MAKFALEVVDHLEGFLVPEEAAVAMIQSCAATIAQARTLPDVKKVITQAEAIDAVMKKINASAAVKRAALALLLDAERQLGVISKALPKARRGGYPKGGGAGAAGKRQVLKSHGINHLRAYTAEKLSDAPTVAIDVAIDSAKTKTVSGVATALGYRAEWKAAPPASKEYVTPEKRSRDLAYLADEAVSALERCLTTGQSPHAGTVAEFRQRLQRLRA